MGPCKDEEEEEDVAAVVMGNKKKKIPQSHYYYHLQLFSATECDVSDWGGFWAQNVNFDFLFSLGNLHAAASSSTPSQEPIHSPFSRKCCFAPHLLTFAPATAVRWRMLSSCLGCWFPQSPDRRLMTMITGISHHHPFPSLHLPGIVLESSTYTHQRNTSGSTCTWPVHKTHLSTFAVLLRTGCNKFLSC